MKISKKIISFLLVLTMMVTNVLFPSMASYAMKDQYNNEKLDNLVFLNKDLNNVIYTYEQNGEFYKVMEKADSALTEIETDIYKQSASGEYELVSNRVANITDEKVDLTIYENGEVYNEQYNIDSAYDKNNDKENFHVEFKNVNSYSSSSWGPYSHTRTYNGSERFTKLTYLVVVAVMSAVVGGSLKGSLVAGAIAAIDTIAAFVISESIGNAYYTKEYYYKHRNDNYNIRMEKTYTTFYEDRAKTRQIDDEIMNEEFQDYSHVR